MKEKRYTSTTVRDKKNLQRTLNTFAEQYTYTAIEITDEPAYQFYFFDNFSAFKSEYIVFDKTIAEIHLTDTNKLLEANQNMFEHKPYQKPLESIIKKLKVHGKLDNRTIEVNIFFTKEKEKILPHLHNELERVMEKTLSERFVIKLYTTLKNRVLYPFLYFNNYASSRNHEPSPYNANLESIISQHYNFYKEYKWILKERENFEYYYRQIEEEPHNPIVQEWYAFMEFLVEHKIEKRLLKSAKFLGRYIDLFLGRTDNIEKDTVLKYFRKYWQQESGSFSFVLKQDRIIYFRLKKYLEVCHYHESLHYKQIGLIHFAINKRIPYDDQAEIFRLYLSIYENNYESVLDFSNLSRKTYTPNGSDDYFYAKYGYYPDEEEADEDIEQYEEEEEETYDSFPRTNTPSDCSWLFEDEEEEKIKIPSKKPDDTPKTVIYDEIEEIPF